MEQSEAAVATGNGIGTEGDAAAATVTGPGRGGARARERDRDRGPGAAGGVRGGDAVRSRSGVVKLPAALSPSRAGDFQQCPLLFRLRVVDKVPEPPNAAATKGTLVHAVLERLFDLPAGRRTPGEAVELLRPQWERLLAERPELGGLFADDEERGQWLVQAEKLLGTYFTLEDPNRLEPAQRELFVRAPMGEGEDRLVLRGFVDRLDVAPNGLLRVVDYKTGKAPPPGYEEKSLFQMKFYALVLWKVRGVVPKRLQLLFLGNGEVLSYDPTEADLLATERKINALWRPSSGPGPAATAGPARAALRLVRSPGAVPRVRRHPAATAGHRAQQGDTAGHRESRLARLSRPPPRPS